MLASLIVLSAFFALNLAAGFYRGRKGGAPSLDRFSLADRSLRSLPLFATLAATNFSAYTVFGLSGAGYRFGWAWYPAMAFGTGLMALSFFVVGMPARALGAAHGWSTQGALVAGRLGSPVLGKAMSLVLLVLTLPYIAAQAVAGGRLLAAALGLPYALATALVLGTATAYVLKGGMRAVVRTDVLQLGILILVAGSAFFVVGASGGGLAAAGARLRAEASSLLEPAGGGPGLSTLALAGTWLLWLLADPMFPQLFQRFYAARDDRALARSASLYPLVTGLLFFFPIAAGLVGAALEPGLDAAGSEGVFHALSERMGGPWLGAAFVAGALAALLSTLDSQLLAVAALAVDDFMPALKGRAWAYRLAAAIVAAVAWLLALRPPASILDFLNRAAFPGYAAAAPLVLVALYAPGLGAFAAGGALAVGVGLATFEAFGLFSPPLPAAIFNLACQALALFALAPFSRALARRGGPLPALASAERAPWRLIAATASIAGLGILVRVLSWPPILVAGMPIWIFAWMLLGLGLALAFAWAGRSSGARGRG